MSQTQKVSEFSDFAPRTERRGPLPISSLPGTPLSDEADPAVEIRTLIDQLQNRARDARLEVRAIEQEKDSLALELSRAQQQIESLRANERELRSHFVEVTSLIRERDAAVDESERRRAAVAEAQRELEAARRERAEVQRLREEAMRQRDDAVRKLENFSRAGDEQSRLISETQKQILTIRQARDSAHTQALDLTNRLARADDELADVTYQRDMAEKAARQATADASECRRQLDITTSDRDATAKQVEELTRELDEQRIKFLDLAAQKSAETTADDETVAALAEARAQMAGLTQERDAARQRAQEQARELDELRQEFQRLRDEEARESSAVLAEAREKIAAFETNARDARHEAESFKQQLEAAIEQLSVLQFSAADNGARQTATQDQMEALMQERDFAAAALEDAGVQIARLAAERDQAQVSALDLERQMATVRAQTAMAESGIEDAKAREAELRELTRRFEKQRVDTIDLAAQLQAAQREIRELSASLAEARLQAKFATATSRAAKSGTTKSEFASIIAESAPDPSAPRSAPLADGVEEPLTEKEARGAINAMRQCFQSHTKAPADFSLLNELHCHVHGFAERARISGYIAVHRLCSAFSDLTRGLYEIPERVNPSTSRTIHQTIEFLASLMKEKDIAQAKDPAKALVYAVDDDIDNCQSIAMAMETSMMRTNTAQDPALALAELATQRCDLIYLDVNMPGMDGFELCKQIRSIAIHRNTPIVFLTGLATLENRIQSTESGGNDFIAKPFNLYELSVKALTLILKTHFRLT